jgi:hypothetical protein
MAGKERAPHLVAPGDRAASGGPLTGVTLRHKMNLAMRAPNLSENALKVLQPLRERAMDGYSLQSRTGLTPDELATALQELRSQELIIVKGELIPDRIGDAYCYVPPDALGYADVLLGRIRSASR